MEKYTEQILKSLSQKFDDLILQGLKLKGYNFDDMADATKFIKENCSCADDLLNQQKTYYVKEIPFLLYDYKMNIEVDYSDNATFTGYYGKYAFL